MALALGSARLNVTAKGASAPPVQHVKPARTSIAEDAIFIPKPHKRVEFKLDAGGDTVGLGNGKPNANPIPLPGQTADGGGVMQPMGAQDPTVTVTGQNIATGTLGEHGLTNEFGKDSYVAPKQTVKAEYIAVPQKDFSVIAPQEEGRQTNNAKQTYFTQQYDAYGRPRIGFSREPYDFAATKYVSKTSEIKFQENMKATKQAYSKYTASDAAPTAPEPNAPASVAGTADSAQTSVQQGMIDPEAVKGTKGLVDAKAVPEKFIGADKAPQEGMIAYDPKKAAALGDNAKNKKGMVDAEPAGAPGKTNAPDPQEGLMKGESAMAVAEKMGMNSSAIMTPSGVGAPDNGGAIPPIGGNNAPVFLPAMGSKGSSAGDAGLGGKTASEIAAIMGMNISATLSARPEKVADFHAAAPLLKSSAAISISA